MQAISYRVRILSEKRPHFRNRFFYLFPIASVIEVIKIKSIYKLDAELGCRRR